MAIIRTINSDLGWTSDGTNLIVPFASLCLPADDAGVAYDIVAGVANFDVEFAGPLVKALVEWLAQNNNASLRGAVDLDIQISGRGTIKQSTIGSSRKEKFSFIVRETVAGSELT